MDRRTRELLAQTLQEQEQWGASTAMAQLRPAQAAVLERHLDVWERLSAVRRHDLDPRAKAAGKERMLAALYSKSRRGRGVFSRLLLTPLVRSAVIVLGLLVLTGAAAGASAALGGPHIWRTVGVNRNSDNVIERSDTGEMNPAGNGTGSEAGGSNKDTGDQGGPGSGEARSSSDGSDANEGYVHDEETEEYEDDITSDAAPGSGAEGAGAGAASSSPEDDDLDDHEGQDHEDKERSATPKLDLTPTPILQDRANMAYDGDDGDGVREADGDPDDENSSPEGDGDDSGGNSSSSAAAQPRRGPNPRAEQEKPKGQGQSSQQPSRR